jgi:hypothetical protein
MVYVDTLKPCLPNARWPWRHSAHLFADSEGELHRFAAAIGLQRSWFQRHNRLDHYDLTYGKRRQAVTKGAVEVTDKELVAMFKPAQLGLLP